MTTKGISEKYGVDKDGFEKYLQSIGAAKFGIMGWGYK